MDPTEIKHHSRLYEEIVLKSWWLILFFLVCFFIYDRASYVREKEEKSLLKKEEALFLRQKKAVKLNEELRQEQQWLNDPAYIEMILMKSLGLVPEGQTKVIFIPNAR